METIKHKAFLSTLILINTDARKARVFLNDKRMTFQEKSIVLCFFALRDFENQEVINQLEKMTCTDLFVESQRLFCLGAAYNNLTHFNEAKIFLKRSIDLNKFKGAEVLNFLASQSLFTVYLNLHNLSGMQKMIYSMKKFARSFPDSEFIIKFCEFTFEVRNLDFKSAQKSIINIERNFETLNEHQRISFLYTLFDFYIFQDKYDETIEIIQRIKNIKKYKNANHVIFMNTMISFLVEDSQLYLYENNYIKYPLMYHQIMCLKALEVADEMTATKAWYSLQLLDSRNYKKPFEYLGPPNLFKKVLEKLVSRSSKPVIISQDLLSLNKDEKLLYLLKNANGPVSKEQLYQEIWENQVQSKDDFIKLVKLVSRVKEKFNVNIKTMKGTYLLTHKKSA